MRLKTLFCLLFILIFSSSVFARWQTIEDANNEIEFYNRDVVVNKDGTSVEIIESQAKILKEGGRNVWANYPLIYNAATSKIEVIEAKTIYDGKEYPLDASLFEDKPLASSPQGFDQYNQISLAYPNAEVGAKLYLKYKETNHTAVLKDFFATDFIYGHGGFLSKSKVTLKSELPLYISVNDPDKVLFVSTNKKHKFNELKIELKKPVYREVIDEHYLVDPKHLPWASVSSVDAWDELAQKIGPAYKKVINQPLPDTFIEIKNIASSKATDYEKINTVTSLLAEKIQYMGDWKTVEGKFIPHDLSHIAKIQLGDCKDFTASTSAILQSLGYKVQPVLVKRGLSSYQPPNELPSLSHFNHVFLKVILKDKTSLWIDPTNFVSMADGIFPDIANKFVFIIDPDAPSIERAPSTSPEHMQLIVDQKWDLGNSDVTHAKGTLLLLGEEAQNITGAQMMTSEKAIKDFVFNFVGDQYLEAEKSITLPDLNSRIVKDLTFKFEYEQANSRIKTNFGPAVSLPLNFWVNNFIRVKSDQVSDIFVGPPSKVKFKTTIENVTIKNPQSLAKKISTKWLDVERKITVNNSAVTIEDEVDIKRFFIANKEIKSKEYLKLKQTLVKNFKSVAIVVGEKS